MSFTFLVMVGLIISVLIGMLASGAGSFPPFVFRERCQGSAWRRAFPDAAKHDIRDFLLFFVDAFDFPPEERLKFNPNDTILGIYRELYPSKWMPDALELETLTKQMQDRFGLALSSIWSEELTLGELFSEIQRSRGAI